MPTILITGASSGIGKATADYFLSKGWKVIATMRKPKEIPGMIVLPLDVTKPATIKTAINKAGPIDVLVNNAGYGLSGAIEECTAEEITRQFQTNVFGLVAVIQAVLPNMKKRNIGTIINISSIVGKISIPRLGYYCATKHAVEALSEALWHELYATNVHVKIVEPGMINTQFQKHAATGIKDAGSNPIVLARCIYKAAVSKNKRLRYHAGKYSSSLLARKIFPDWLFLRLVHWFEK